MLEMISQYKDLMDLLVQVITIVVPAFLAWLGRKYVKSVEDEKKIAAIIRLANAAIDYAEDLDKRGELDKMLKNLNFSNDIIEHTSKGIQKLNIAGKWAEHELNRLGIKITDEEAQKWIAAEFQKRVGSVLLENRGIVQQAKDTMNLLEALERQGLIELPAHINQVAQLTDQVTGWLESQYGDREKITSQETIFPKKPTAEAALKPQVPSGQPETIQETDPSTLSPSSVNASEEMSGDSVTESETSLEIRLAELARQSVAYVEELKANYELTIPEIDIATAWVLTEVTKRGLSVRPDQIAKEIHVAFGRQKET